MEDILIRKGDEVPGRIVFGQDTAGVAPVLETCAGSRPVLHVYVVCDINAAGYADRIVSALPAGGAVRICGRYMLKATEEDKTMDSVLSMSEWLLTSGADRNAFILAVGGGITTDMAGFAASIYKRGVKFAYVPTTLLSQVDAAIGGKTGVNYLSYKNMLGVIRQPEFTRGFMGKAMSFLSGLHEAEDKSGYLKDNRPELLSLIHAAASVKAGVVSRDQFENGERRKLNLGHTFAHAIEKNARMAGDDITHGEAVSIGMVMAAGLSERLGLAPGGFAPELAAGLLAAGLPVDCPYPVRDLIEAMSKDKKAEDGIVHFVLPAGPGDVRIVDMTASRAGEILA